VTSIGIIGIGNMGQNHLRNLTMIKHVDVAFIYDTNDRQGREISCKYNINFSRNLDKDLEKVDAVIIATPTITHYDYILKVSQFVKYIFIEKPLTHDIETTKKINELSKEKGLHLQVGFIERYNPAVSALKRVLKNSNHIINIDFFRTNKVSARILDVDVVMDLMIHDIDLCIWLNGPISQVEACGYKKKGSIEYAKAQIIHANGCFSSLVASRITEKRIRHINVTCDDMYVDCNLLSKEVLINKQSLEQYLEDISISSKTETIDVKPQEALLLELLNFIKLCRGEAIDVPGVNDALNAIVIADKVQAACYRTQDKKIKIST
jgi:predicted dehydrogenase